MYWLAAQIMARLIPDHIQHQRTAWWRGHVSWVTIHWTLSALATLSAALAAAITSQAQIFEVIAASASSLIRVANPYRRSRSFARAHRLLSKAIIAYECDDNFPIQALLKAHDEGEEIIDASEN